MQISGIATVAPTSFSEMYREHYDYVLTLVQKFGIDPQNVEDVASVIMTKAFEKGLVEQYSSDRISEHTGKQVPFKSLLYGFVSAYVRHHRERQTIYKRRDAAYFLSEDEETTGWLAERGLYHVDHFEDLFQQELVRQIRTRCQAIVPHQNQAVSLATFFDFVMMQVEEAGAIDKHELKGLFEISSTTLGRLLTQLRGIVDQVVAEA